LVQKGNVNIRMQQLQSSGIYRYRRMKLYIQYYTSFGICSAFRIRRKVTELTTSPCQREALKHATYEGASIFHTAADTRNPDVAHSDMKWAFLRSFGADLMFARTQMCSLCQNDAINVNRVTGKYQVPLFSILYTDSVFKDPIHKITVCNLCNFCVTK
jgi:hypothetical protein